MQLLTLVRLNTFIKIKKFLINIKKKRETIFEKIGKDNIIVQVVETAICQGRIIENLFSEVDDIPGVQWLVCGVEETRKKLCFMELVTNRFDLTLYWVFVRM
ncbi:hypothetical protein DMUE_2209 [Dictyocoela muelleri]|nr:hypothetical protein DMUE_2209 [Dictyocoela muelleri]